MRTRINPVAVIAGVIRSSCCDHRRNWNSQSEAGDQAIAFWFDVHGQCLKTASGFPSAAVAGQPGESGTCIIRVKLPHHTKMLPHRYLEDWIHIVMSGVIYLNSHK